jgi:hypothetical protein
MMLIRNIHERLLPCHVNSAAFLIDDFAKKEASLWPSTLWPREVFDRPLQVGALGSHGGTQYVVDSYAPGRQVTFKFITPKAYLGFHRFELVESDDANTLIRHTVEFEAKRIPSLIWRHLIQWVHDALIEDAFDCAQHAIGSTPKQPRQWPKRVHVFRHMLGASRLITNGFKVILNADNKHTLATNAYILLNPICNVIIGFRNYTTHSTRSRYISFSPSKQPQMSQLLLDLSSGNASGDMSDKWPDKLFNQLIDYGFFVEMVSFAQRIKNAFRNPLNENRWKKVTYQNKRYLVTSFVFMAFNSQLPKQYVRETVVLPSWTRTFSKYVFQLLEQGASPDNLAHLPNKIKQKLLKHGVLIHKQDYPTLDSFFYQHAQLNNALLEYIPQDKRMVCQKNQDLQLNQRVYFLEDLPQDLADRIYDMEWVLTVNPSVVVEDPITNILSIYWLSEKQAHCLKGLLSHSLAVDALDEEMQTLFSSIYILEHVDALKARALHWQETIQKAREELSDKKIITLRDVIAPVYLAIARKYIRHFVENKYFIADNANGKTKERYWQHRDDFTFFIQSQMCTLLNQILPEPVKLGHNAITVYKPGATLPKHIDDVLAFSWVMSVPLDTQPEINREHAWPIFVETDSETVLSASLGMGDAVLMNPQMPHWREMLEESSLGIVFLWFIPANYSGYVNGHWID